MDRNQCPECLVPGGEYHLLECSRSGPNDPVVIHVNPDGKLIFGSLRKQAAEIARDLMKALQEKAEEDK